MVARPRQRRFLWPLMAGGMALAAMGVGFAGPGEEGVPSAAPHADPSDRERSKPGQARRDDPETLRVRLEFAIERGEQMLDRHRVALEALENGASPSEVMQSLRIGRGPLMSPGWRERQERRGDPVIDAASTGERSEPSPEEMRALIREHFPELFAQLQMIGQNNPGAGDRLIRKMGSRIRSIAFDLQIDPILGELRIQEVRAGLAVGDRARAYHSARSAGDADAVARSEQALRDAIGAQFDARMAMRQHEVTQLFDRVGRLNEEIIEETQGRDRAIEEVFESIINRQRRPARP